MHASIIHRTQQRFLPIGQKVIPIETCLRLGSVDAIRTPKPIFEITRIYKYTCTHRVLQNQTLSGRTDMGSAVDQTHSELDFDAQ